MCKYLSVLLPSADDARLSLSSLLLHNSPYLLIPGFTVLVRASVDHNVLHPYPLNWHLLVCVQLHIK